MMPQYNQYLHFCQLKGLDPSLQTSYNIFINQNSNNKINTTNNTFQNRDIYVIGELYDLKPRLDKSVTLNQSQNNQNKYINYDDFNVTFSSSDGTKVNLSVQKITTISTLIKKYMNKIGSPLNILEKNYYFFMKV